MPLTGAGSAISFKEEQYREVLSNIVHAGQIGRHLFGIMDYVPRAKLSLFPPIDSVNYYLARNSAEEIVLYFEGMNTSGRQIHGEVTADELARILDSVERSKVPTPKTLWISFLKSIDEPLKEYARIEPERASDLRDRIELI